MNDELRSMIRNEIIEQVVEEFRDFEARVDLAVDGTNFKGVNNMSDQELVDYYLSSYESDEEFRDQSGEEDKDFINSDEYRKHWAEKTKEANS